MLERRARTTGVPQISSMRLSVAVVSLLTSAPVAAQQGLKVTPNIAASYGVVGKYASGTLLRFDFNPVTLGPVELGFGGSKWWLGIECELVPGGSCDDDAIAVDLGATLPFGTPGGGLDPYVVGRIGRFYYSSDRALWDGVVGAGVRWLGKRTIGFTADIRYHALFGADSDLMSAPPSDDYFTILAGVMIRF
jgi:hypothetical protein